MIRKELLGSVKHTYNSVMFAAVRVFGGGERRRMLLKIETFPSLIANAIKPIRTSSKGEAGTAALWING
jgi:hypothetical protein